MSRNLFSNMLSHPHKTNIKIALIGDGATGKTSYFERLVSGHLENYKFKKSYNATHSCNICQIEYSIGKHKIKIHLFDTAGQEKFGTLRDSYLFGVDGVILMYDLTQRDTKQNVVNKWLPEIKRILKTSKTKHYVPVIVVGNKNDKINNSFPNESLGIRMATLKGSYESYYGSIEHTLISVKADENLMKPINWLLQNVLSYIFPVKAKKSNDEPIVLHEK